MFKIIVFFGCWLTFLLSVGCTSSAGTDSGPRLGGACEYRDYPGMAEIISVEKVEGRDDAWEIRFLFISDEPIEQRFVKNQEKTYLLLMKDGSYPGYDFVETNDISPGQRLDCVMKVIIRGTCTPVLFDFPGLER